MQSLSLFRLLVNGVLLIGLVSGCASMSEKECLTANWFDQGYRDGRNGEPLSRLEDHRQACEKVGIIPERARYFEGRDKGILEYCTPANALYEGRQGRYYRNSCPAHLERNFLIYYQDGKRVYEAEQQVEELNRRSNQLQNSLKKEKDEATQNTLRRELREIDRELRRARDNVRYQERRVRY